jgi:hypothetical protein
MKDEGAKMILRGRWRLGAVILGLVCFGFGVFQLAAARRGSERYDQISSGVQARAPGRKGTEPRALVMLLRRLGDLRHDTDRSLAQGLLGATSGMSLIALGSQGMLARRRRASRHPFDRHLRVVGGSLARSDEGPPVATTDILEDEERALLARFDALEKRALLERHSYP